MSAAVLINMLSIYTNIATNLNASWSCFSTFFEMPVFCISIPMKCISYDPTYLLKVMIRTQTSMLLLENDPANLSFMVFCKNMINEVISSRTRSKPYINYGIRYWYKNFHFHNNQPSFDDHRLPILRACELTQGGVFRRDQTGDGRCEWTLE